MKMVKRWGVMTLVALLVLGTMGAALADEPTIETETETAKTQLEQGSYVPVLGWASDLLQFVFYWGYDEGVTPDCPAWETEGSTGMFGFGGSALVTEEGECVFLDVEKNGHYNHGSLVSSFVHWLKAGNLQDLAEANPELQDMPKGQLVKTFAHQDFGKGNFELPDEDGSTVGDDDADESDGHGPPAWVLEKKADKAAKGKKK